MMKWKDCTKGELFVQNLPSYKAAGKTSSPVSWTWTRAKETCIQCLAHPLRFFMTLGKSESILALSCLRVWPKICKKFLWQSKKAKSTFVAYMIGIDIKIYLCS